jgi:hypothetical protein
VSENPIDALQTWYAAQCDGDWEHEYGVEITTLDNPGWMLRVNLVGTALEGKELVGELNERTETDWFDVKSDGQTFIAAGGPHKLTTLIDEFVNFAKPS